MVVLGPFVRSLILATLGFGEPPNEPAAPEQVPVRVSLVLDENQAPLLGALLEEYLGTLGAPIVLARTDALDLATILGPGDEAPAPALARIWIRPQGERVSIFIADPAWTRIYIRHLELPNGLDEVAREEVAMLVMVNVESLLAGGTIGVHASEAADMLGVELEPPPEPEPAPEPEPEPAPEPEPVTMPVPELRSAKLTPSWTLGGGVGLGYGAQLWAVDAAPQHGPKVDGRLAFHPSRRRSPIGLLGLSFGWYVPARVRGEAFDLILHGFTVHVEGGVAVVMGRRAWFRPQLGLGVELLHERSVAELLTAEPMPPAWRPVPAGGASVMFEVGLVDHVRIAFGPTLAVRPVALSYRVGDTDEVVFQPWTVRPGFTIELRWDRH
jgi:hypothetical protein